MHYTMAECTTECGQEVGVGVGVGGDGGGGGGWTRAAISRVPEHWPRSGKVKLGRGGATQGTGHRGRLWADAESTNI